MNEKYFKNIFGETSAIQNMLAEQERLSRLIDPYQGALADAARMSDLANIVKPSVLDSVVAKDILGHVTVPDLWKGLAVTEIAGLASLQDSLAHSSIMEAVDRYRLKTDAISRAMAAMQSPWLNMQDQMRSISALTELHGIGHILNIMPNYDHYVTGALRIDLGDWRGSMVFDAATMLDARSRSELYLERGFDPDLTIMPAPAFRESLVSAGLYDANAPAHDDEDEEEAAFMRTNEAHDRLMRFEHRLRIIINDMMITAVGVDWIQHRVPQQMRESWASKRDKDIANGQPDRPLISYADFTDYVQIIIRKDNWRDVFGAVFEHKPSVEESFRRLFPVRICTMHARPITQDDALFLLVEIKRLSKAMGFD